MRIRSSLVGLIIGREGWNLERIHRETNARIIFSNRIVGSDKQTIRITGTRDQVQLAQQMIEQRLTTLHDSNQWYT